MNSQIISHRHAIKKIYSPDSLDDIIKSANNFERSEAGNVEFSAFQRNILQTVFTGFSYNFCVTSIVETDANGTPIDISCALLDLPDDILDNYMKVVHLDPLTPLTYLNPGRAINYSKVMTKEAVYNHPFYKQHLSKYDIFVGISICVLFPSHHNTYLTIDYLATEENTSWDHFDHSRMELASFPFILAWFYRRKLMDLVELKRRFMILEGLTEHQLQNLRKFVNSPDQHFKEQADDLGIKTGTLKDDLYNTRDIILPRLGLDELSKAKKSGSPLRKIESECSFLKLLGDHTQPMKSL